jgi:8-oxo-dGTP pyrophosphatase MutT (NUDIX family)
VADDAPLEPAATLLLHDERERIVLLRRSASLAFLPSVHVFPGGRITEADRGLAAGYRGDIEMVAARIAAIRETFEETGVLAACTCSATVAAEALAEWRVAVSNDPALFGPMLLQEGWTLQPDALVWFDRWRTPPVERRRYDTLFFAAPLPGSASIQCDGSETVAQWIGTAHEALRAHADGALPMAPPTLHVLHGIADAPSFERWLWARERSEKPPIEPVVVREDAQAPSDVVLALPGDAAHPAPYAVDPPRRFRWTSAGWHAQDAGPDEA